jgi:uncharacterized membrane protein YkgB
MRGDTLVATGFTMAYLAVMGGMLALMMPTVQLNKHILFPVMIALALLGSGLIGAGKARQQ